MVMVALSFANNFLDVRLAGNEFSSNQQFMQTTGLQIDSAAWTIGRTQTVQYTTRFGQVLFVPGVLNYTFEVSRDNGASYQSVLTCTTGMILFNMPVSAYNLGKNYFSQIFPVSNASFLQWGPSAPVGRVFATEETPMLNGTYARVVTVPTVRLINSTLAGGTQYYFKFYLPSLISGSNPYLSQSITLTGNNVGKVTASGTITNVRITATAAPVLNPPGFDLTFFKFDHTTEIVNIPSGSSTSLVEFYTGMVIVSMGLTI
jgi:hypothetical protein